MRNTAPVWVAAIYGSRASHVFAELGTDNAYERLTNAELESGLIEDFEIDFVVMGWPKMIIDMKAERRGEGYDEQIVLIAGRIADFTSAPVEVERTD